MHPDLTLGVFLLCRFWTLVIFSPAVTVTSLMDSIEETMMRMSYSQQAANLDGGEDVGMCRLGQDGGAGKNADLVERMGEVDWPVRIASSCRRQPQKSVALLTLASKITNKYSTMDEHGHASLPSSFWYLYHLPRHFLATREFTAIALVF